MAGEVGWSLPAKVFVGLMFMDVGWACLKTCLIMCFIDQMSGVKQDLDEFAKFGCHVRNSSPQ